MSTHSCGRKMESDSVRVIPEFREHIDINLFCQAIIEIAKSISKEKAKPVEQDAKESKQT